MYEFNTGTWSSLDFAGRLPGILLMSTAVGAASGLFGVRGGVLLFPVLAVLFGLDVTAKALT